MLYQINEQTSFFRVKMVKAVRANLLYCNKKRQLYILQLHGYTFLFTLSAMTDCNKRGVIQFCVKLDSLSAHISR